MNQIPIDAKDKSGKTVLHYACKSDFLNLIKNLVERPELGVAATDVEKKNILHIACEELDDISVIRFIVLLNKININDKSEN